MLTQTQHVVTVTSFARCSRVSQNAGNRMCMHAPITPSICRQANKRSWRGQYTRNPWESAAVGRWQNTIFFRKLSLVSDCGDTYTSQKKSDTMPCSIAEEAKKAKKKAAPPHAAASWSSHFVHTVSPTNTELPINPYENPQNIEKMKLERGYCLRPCCAVHPGRPQRIQKHTISATSANPRST